MEHINMSLNKEYGTHQYVTEHKECGTYQYVTEQGVWNTIDMSQSNEHGTPLICHRARSMDLHQCHWARSLKHINMSSNKESICLKSLTCSHLLTCPSGRSEDTSLWATCQWPYFTVQWKWHLGDYERVQIFNCFVCYDWLKKVIMWYTLWPLSYH